MLVTQAGVAAKTATWPGLGDLLGLRPEYMNEKPAYKHNAVAILSGNKNRTNAIPIDMTKLRRPVPPYKSPNMPNYRRNDHHCNVY